MDSINTSANFCIRWFNVNNCVPTGSSGLPVGTQLLLIFGKDSAGGRVGLLQQMTEADP